MTMNTDNRQDWEIAISIEIQNAHSYAHYLDLDPTRKRIYGGAFGITEDFDEWAERMAQEALARADELVQQHGPVTFAPAAVVGYAEYLRARGWNGTALDAGGFRIDATPQP